MEGKSGVNPHPLLLFVLLTCLRKELLARAHGVFNQQTILSVLPSIQSAEEAPPDFLRVQHVVGMLQDHHLEDDEPLGVLVARSDSVKLRVLISEKVSYNLPSWRFVPARW